VCVKKEDLKNLILDTIKSFGKKRVRRRQLYNLIGRKGLDYEDFKSILTEMEESGEIARMKGRRFALPEESGLFTGIFTLSKNGGGYIRRKEGDSVYVPPRNAVGAVTGDLVQAKISRRRRAGFSPTAKIVDILERSAEPVVGIYKKTGKTAYVVPRDAAYSINFIVKNPDDIEAEDGHLVVVKVESQEKGFTLPLCTVTEVLGDPDAPGVDVLAIVKHHNLPVVFPDEVLEEAGNIPDDITQAVIDAREDIRSLVTFTIDPADAKDFDDAVSIRKNSDGTYHLGVHIADVSYYVKDSSPTDLEAEKRGMSCYLVDRVIPMLPERLSNDLCSLKPGEDKLTKSVFAVIDNRGNVRESRIANTIIRSRMRLSYEQVQSYLDGEKGEGGESIPSEVGESLRILSELTDVLSERRKERGALDFENPEARVILDDNGKPVDIVKREQLKAHRMIEEAMILANVVTAHALADIEVPFLYRVHEEPDPLRIEAFAETARALGFTFKASLASDRGYIQSFLESIKGTDTERTLNLLLLRSMKRACYSPDNRGHYGLALPVYTHFTSPIRRYPDLIVHRQIDSRITEVGDSGKLHDDGYYEALGDAVTEREQATDEAERESIKMKAAEFMRGHIGEEFDGIITGIMSMGFFVGLERYYVEGLVHVSTLHDDYYTPDTNGVAMIGQSTGHRYMMGDRVRVIVVRADKEQGEIDFMVVQELKKRNSGRKKSGRTKRRKRK